jgi:adenylosuccinate synthase
MRTPVDVIFGGQYGSEGKGVIAAFLATDYDVHVRVGAPNAGHSFLGPDRELWKMQTVPCGWVNPKAVLIIGRGGLIDPRIMRAEVEAIARIDSTIYARLYVDAKCGVLDSQFHRQEGGVDGEMHKRIGSTGEGVGPAREARISRDPSRFRLYSDLSIEDPWFAQFQMENTPFVINQLRLNANRVLLEGAQGQGLSLIHGPWPFCTSTDPGPAQLCADVGIPPTELGRVIACMRTFPIRVAGNSGPLPNETTWEAMSQRLGKSIEERTTVTKKIRRVAFWDDNVADMCRIIHRPTDIALTFMDYINPVDAGVNCYNSLSVESQQFITRVEQVMQAHVSFVATGGPKLRVFRRP